MGARQEPEIPTSRLWQTAQTVEVINMLSYPHEPFPYYNSTPEEVWIKKSTDQTICNRRTNILEMWANMIVIQTLLALVNAHLKGSVDQFRQHSELPVGQNSTMGLCCISQHWYQAQANCRGLEGPDKTTQQLQCSTGKMAKPAGIWLDHNTPHEGYKILSWMENVFAHEAAKARLESDHWHRKRNPQSRSIPNVSLKSTKHSSYTCATQWMLWDLNSRKRHATRQDCLADMNKS